MERKSMTALVSAFSRAYHSENNDVKIFNDSIAKLLLSESEYNEIAKSMSGGIMFFNPSFVGSENEALRWIVENQLSPSPLGRAAFTEKALKTAVSIGAMQYLIFAAGYDTFAYRQPYWANRLQIFEIDHPATAKDKQARLAKSGILPPNNIDYVEADFTKEMWQTALMGNANFDKSKISFCSLLGLSYYLSKQVFTEMISVMGEMVPKGSSLVFDYPDQDTYTEKAGERAKKQAILAGGAKEAMLASYSYEEMRNLLSNCGFLIYEHLEPSEITKQYFHHYNKANPHHPMTAFDNVNYCLAVRK